MSTRRGQKSKYEGCRQAFLWSPKRELAEKVETLVRECDMSANSVLSTLIEYALSHVELKTRRVMEIKFVDEEVTT